MSDQNKQSKRKKFRASIIHQASASKGHRVLDEVNCLIQDISLPSRDTNTVANSFAPPVEGKAHSNGKPKSKR